MENIANKMDNIVISNDMLGSSDYLDAVRRTFDDLYQKEDDMRVMDLLSKTITRIDEVHAKISQRIWVTKDNEKKLIANLPEEGNYTVLMRNDDETNLSN